MRQKFEICAESRDLRALLSEKRAVYADFAQNMRVVTGCRCPAAAFFDWFRWKGCRRDGRWVHGAEAETHCDALQVYDSGAWHPVVAFSHGYMGPAADYTVAGVKMFKEV